MAKNLSTHYSVPDVKILVVDDEKLVLDQISEVLETMGYEVIKGKDGKEAIKMFEKNNPDLLLLDISTTVSLVLSFIQSYKHSVVGKIKF